LFLAGVDSAKEKLSAKLRVEKPEPSFCHFPLTRDREYFTQLCSERITIKHINGFAAHAWVKSPSARNESWDCRVYCLTALHGLYQHGFNLDNHCQQFELMCSPAASDRPAQSAYQVIKSKSMS
jgi:phage terminase large subunit GpA-like protein